MNKPVSKGHYLDCGCYIDENGKRCWCPSCLHADKARNDSDRIHQLHDMLMQADQSVSDALGLPKGWVDLRRALDELHNGR